MARGRSRRSARSAHDAPTRLDRRGARDFVVRARAILAGVDEAKNAIRPGRGVAGRVVLSVPPSLGLGRIGPLVPSLLADNPRLRIEMRFEDRVVDLLEDGVDVAVRAGRAPPDSPFVVARHLGTFGRVLCASPRLLAKTGRIDDVAKLAQLPCVLHGAAPTTWELQTAGGRESVTVDGRLRTNNLLAVRDAVVAGLGIGWLPSWLVAADVRARRLARVLDGATMPAIDVYGLFHPQGRTNAAVRAVLDRLGERAHSTVTSYPATSSPPRLSRRTTHRWTIPGDDGAVHPSVEDA